MRRSIRAIGQTLLSKSMRRRIIRSTRWPPVGLIRYGNLRSLRPVNPQWGSERGQPIDRYYIERFLDANRQSIAGRVLEIGTDTYTRRFGGESVTRSDVLHVMDSSPGVTIVADLTDPTGLPTGVFDCVIVTQTLQFIFDVPGAVRTLHRTLRPGGVALVTVPGITQISRYDMDRFGQYWSFTARSIERIFAAVFPHTDVEIEGHGNVLVAISLLHGIASNELTSAELEHLDPDYPVLITIRAVKSTDDE